ncbi:MAG TPA: hypothetical protein VJT31_34945 [Rugosimonospora sp.]|nr:hypothetical protein [Rugosimonospora sp.]
MQGRTGDGSARNFTTTPVDERSDQTLTIDLAEYDSLKGDGSPRRFTTGRAAADHAAAARVTAASRRQAVASQAPAMLSTDTTTASPGAQ